jgi:hypothetical protein
MTWTVVTAQEEDGHTKDVYFITEDQEVIKRFSQSVVPLKVYGSSYPTKEEAREFANGFDESGYVEITPK